MTLALVFDVVAPLQAWDDQSAGIEGRAVRPAPTKSGLVGLVGNALGHCWDSPSDLLVQGDLAGLRLLTMVDRPGSLTRDFHIANCAEFGAREERLPRLRTASGAASKNLSLSHRYYLSDAAFRCALVGEEGQGNLLEEAMSALNFPRKGRLLAFGRKVCIPGMPLRARLFSLECVANAPAAELLKRVTEKDEGRECLLAEVETNQHGLLSSIEETLVHDQPRVDEEGRLLLRQFSDRAVVNVQGGLGEPAAPEKQPVRVRAPRVVLAARSNPGKDRLGPETELTPGLVWHTRIRVAAGPVENAALASNVYRQHQMVMSAFSKLGGREARKNFNVLFRFERSHPGGVDILVQSSGARPTWSRYKHIVKTLTQEDMTELLLPEHERLTLVGLANVVVRNDKGERAAEKAELRDWVTRRFKGFEVEAVREREAKREGSKGAQKLYFHPRLLLLSLRVEDRKVAGETLQNGIGRNLAMGFGLFTPYDPR